MSEITEAITRKSIKRLTVKDADGNILLGPTTARRLNLAGGRGTMLLADPASSTITLSSPAALRGNDPFYVRKYRDVLYGNAEIVDGTSDPWPHEPYQFSQDTDPSKVRARYVATINKMTPHRLEDTFFLEGSACWQVGCFDGTSSTVLNDTVSQGRGLTLENKCVPSVDCRDYWVIYEAMERIRLFLQTNRDKNCCTEGSYKLFEQWKATVHYWNYLMYRKKAGVVARSLRAGIAVSAHYEHLCCNPTCVSGHTLSSSSPSSSASGWVCTAPLIFHLRVERMTCVDVPLEMTMYVTDVRTNPRNLHYAMASQVDMDTTFVTSSSSSSSDPVSRECRTTGSSLEGWISMLDPLQFRDYVEAQITIAVTLPEGARTSENLAKLYDCGGFEGAIKFRVQTEWLGACPVNTYAEEEMWVKLLMDKQDTEPTVWACGKTLDATPFLAHCPDFGAATYVEAAERRTTETAATEAAAQTLIDDWCLWADTACAATPPGIPCGCFRSAAVYDPILDQYSISALHCCQ